jgi:transposase
MEAEKASVFVGINRNTVHRIYGKLRDRIVALCEAESPFETGEIELDESYFGARRVRGKRGRGAQGKIPVFGMLKRNGKVYTQNSTQLFYGRIGADNRKPDKEKRRNYTLY